MEIFLRVKMVIEEDIFWGSSIRKVVRSLSENAEFTVVLVILGKLCRVYALPNPITEPQAPVIVTTGSQLNCRHLS